MNFDTVSETERVINLGSLIGKLTSGTGALSGVKEDKRNKVTPGNISKSNLHNEITNCTLHIVQDTYIHCLIS